MFPHNPVGKTHDEVPSQTVCTLIPDRGCIYGFTQLFPVEYEYLSALRYFLVQVLSFRQAETKQEKGK